jgi:hypothetical protein
MKKIITSIATAVTLLFGINKANAQAALNFDGVNDVVITNNNITHGNTFTYEGWMNLISPNDWGGIMTTSTSEGETQWVQFTITGSGVLRTEIVDDAGNNKWYEGTTVLTGAWHHVSITFDGTNLLFYVDGNTETISTMVHDDVLGTITINAPLHIAAERSLGVFNNATLQELRVWNIARTQSQIQNNMNCTVASNATGLIAYYSCNDGIPNGNNASNTTLHDATSNANNGTLTNFALTGTSSNFVPNNALTVQVTTTITATSNTVCAGTPVTLTATTTTGGTSPYMYTWHPGGTAGSSATLTNTTTITPTATTTTSVKKWWALVTDANGCVFTNDTVAVQINSLPQVSTLTSTTITCAGSPVTLTAVPVSGGLAPLSYTWHPGGTTPSATVTTITPSATTATAIKKWFMTVQDANGCVFTNDTVDVQINSLPQVSTLASTTITCAGSPVTLTAVPVSGGLAPLSYTWHPGGTTPSATVTTITPSATTATSVKKWFMTVQDANGCVFTNDTVAVQINALPTVSVTVNTATICAGTMDTLTASGTITSYTWNTIATTASITATPTVTSTYTVMGTGANNCMNMAMATITVNALPTLTITTSAGFSVCPNTLDTLKASGTATSYTWNTTHVVTDYTVHPFNTTTYTLTGVDANGCKNKLTQVITVYPRPTLTVTATSGTVCTGNSTILSTTTGSVSVTSYSWSTGATTPTISVSPVLTSTYGVTGTTAEGCSTTKHYTVTVNPLPTVTAISTEDSICVGGTDSLIASGATSYTWNTSENNPVILVTLTVTTTFTVMGTNGNGCENMATVTQLVSSTCYAGIEKYNGNSNNVSVYPNPSNGNFVITTSENATAILVTDILGNELVSIKPKGNTTNNINLSAQPSGVYFIKVTAGNAQTVKRIIINN